MICPICKEEIQEGHKRHNIEGVIYHLRCVLLTLFERMGKKA